MQWPKDTTENKMRFYGDFRQKAWASQNLIHIKAPFPMYYDKRILSSGILVHRKIADALIAVFQEVWDKSGHDLKRLDATGISDYGGCFNVRRIAGSDNWSNHSWACAIDLSPGTNGFRYNDSTTLSQLVIDAFKRQGARWGGDYKHRKDPMHFEFVSPA